MAILQSLPSVNAVLGPLHLLSYSTLLGMQLYQSFVVTKVCYIALPRSAFTTLNKRIFRTYFCGQVFLILLSAATIPPKGALSLLSSKSAWITFAIAAFTSILNLTLWEPRSRQAMIDRTHQETKDGKKSYDPEPTPEMHAINCRFKRSHAMCIHLNLITMGATLWWGWKLASFIKFDM